jgi:alpha-glucosidase
VADRHGRRGRVADRPDTWHRPTLDRHRALFALRRDQPALVHGGLRFAHIGADALAFWRETPSARLLMLARRTAGRPVRVRGVTDGINVYGGAALDISGDVAVLPGDGPTFQVWSCR